MGQEFVVKSETLEDKVNQLLPSQSGYGAGLDLSASTQIIPIVYLTQAAEGSTLPQEYQKAFGLGSINTAEVTNSTSTLTLTPGFWRLYAVFTCQYTSSIGGQATIGLTDGTSTQNFIRVLGNVTSVANTVSHIIDEVVFIKAGVSLVLTSNAANTNIYLAYRQVALSNGNLVNPSGFAV